jgi:hypothetical protein
MGAVEEPEVPLRERLWNERSTATSREKTGVYRLLCVNVNGINRLRRLGLFPVRGVATRRLLRVNVLKMQGGGHRWRQYPALRPLARHCVALTDASAAGDGWS